MHCWWIGGPRLKENFFIRLLCENGEISENVDRTVVATVSCVLSGSCRWAPVMLHLEMLSVEWAGPLQPVTSHTVPCADMIQTWYRPTSLPMLPVANLEHGPVRARRTKHQTVCSQPLCVSGPVRLWSQTYAGKFLQWSGDRFHG